MKTFPPDFAAIPAKQREMVAEFSPREMEVYAALGENRVNAWIARLKAQVTRRDQLRAELEKHKFVSRTLAEHERAKLSTHLFTNYCRPETLPNRTTYINWPPWGLLPGITERVENYLRFTRQRVKRPRSGWRAFKLLDKRLPSLQLAPQVDELARRALDRLRKDRSLARDARPLMLWLWLIGHPSASKLLKFDPVAQLVVKKFKQHVGIIKAKAKTKAARERKRRQRARALLSKETAFGER
jgi:hypothetical protein